MTTPPPDDPTADALADSLDVPTPAELAHAVGVLAASMRVTVRLVPALKPLVDQLDPALAAWVQVVRPVLTLQHLVLPTPPAEPGPPE